MNSTPTTLHDTNAESAILGCAMQDPQLASDLCLNWFHQLTHRNIAEALKDMAAKGHPMDSVTVISRCEAGHVPGAVALVNEALDKSPSPANFEYWRDILAGKLTLRRIAQTAEQAVARVSVASTDPSRAPIAILDEYERDVLAIRQRLNGDAAGETDIPSAIKKLAAEIDETVREGKPRGLATGFECLDKLIGGLNPQQLVVIAARPSVGKTSLGLNITERLSLDAQTPVAFVSLEMSAEELLKRLACSRARVDSTKLNEGNVSEQEIKRLADACAEIGKAPLHLWDKGGLTLAQLTGQSRRMVFRHGIKLLILDYLGLLRSGERGRGRYEETTLVSNGLKTAAKELDLPIIALCQLNRDTANSRRSPRLSDLRDSGAIEQDADIVILLHRDEDQSGDEQKVNVILAKHRNGRTGQIDLAYKRAFTRFETTTT